MRTFSSSEVAQILDSTEESVTSALKRARATLSRQLHGAVARELAPVLYSPAEQELVKRFTRAFEAGDADSVTLAGRSASGITRFEAGVLPPFGLDQTSTG